MRERGTVIRQYCIFFAGGVVRQRNQRVRKWVMFATMVVFGRIRDQGQNT